MFLLQNLNVAILFCIVTMLCWGSWANTQKLVGKTWRYELFYWDYVFGVVIASLIFAFTMGSNGELGRPFIEDLKQADFEFCTYAFLGGVVFNIANILLVAAIAIAGMSVAFPVGIGLALVLGVLLNYFADPEKSGEPIYLFSGVGLVTLAIIVNALAYRRLSVQTVSAEPVPDESGETAPGNAEHAPAKKSSSPLAKGLILSILCGILMSLFYYFVAAAITGVESGGNVLALTFDNLSKGGTLQTGKMTPYTANVIFAIGILVSNFIVMPILMKKPFVGEPVAMGQYFRGSVSSHFWGLVGGIIWAVGMTFNVVASGVASPAIAYGLGQGATLMSAIWGVFIWREFKSAPKGTGKYLFAMFLFFIVGLGLIIYAKAMMPA